jgi:hypothetical protein
MIVAPLVTEMLVDVPARVGVTYLMTGNIGRIIPVFPRAWGEGGEPL